MAAPPRLTDPFASPREAGPVPLGTLRRYAWFVARRGLRLAMALLVVPMTAILLFGLEDPRRIAMAAGVAVLAWLPATAVQGRVTFAPSPPDPWLSADGVPRADRDQRAWARADVAEWLLGTLPPIVLLVWFVGLRLTTVPLLGRVFLLAVLLGLIAARQAQGVVALLVQEANLDLQALRPVALRWVLELAERPAQLVGRADRVRFLVARARFRDGDVDGALRAIDRIRNTDAWRTDLLRAMFGIDREGADYALVVARSIAADPDLAGAAATLTALARLAQDRDDEVLAAADALTGVRATDGRWFGAILVAAAKAGRDPEGARALLQALPWGEPAARDLARCWSALDRRLSRLPNSL